MLPSAAGFIDPLLSTGFPLTISGILRLAKIIERDWDTAEFGNNLKEYESETLNELSVCENSCCAYQKHGTIQSVFRHHTSLFCCC